MNSKKLQALLYFWFEKYKLAYTILRFTAGDSIDIDLKIGRNRASNLKSSSHSSLALGKALILLEKLVLSDHDLQKGSCQQIISVLDVTSSNASSVFSTRSVLYCIPLS